MTATDDTRADDVPADVPDSGPSDVPGEVPGDEPGEAARRPLQGRRAQILCWGLAAVWLLLDQATKELALAFLADGPIGGDVWRFQLSFNTGMAFGLPSLFSGMFVLVVIAVLVLVWRQLMRIDRLWLAAAYGLLAGGALGNGVDRLFRDPGFPDGAVVDFLAVGWWPIFNLADIGVVGGAATVALLMMLAEREERRAADARADHRSVRPDQTSPWGATGRAGGKPSGQDAPDGGAAGT